MNGIKAIRTRLGLTQSALGDILGGVSQGSMSFYEKGEVAMPPPLAGKLIEFARGKGLTITYDHVYGEAELPPEPAGGAQHQVDRAAPALAAHPAAQHTIDPYVLGTTRRDGPSAEREGR